PQHLAELADFAEQQRTSRSCGVTQRQGEVYVGIDAEPAPRLRARAREELSGHAEVAEQPGAIVEGREQVLAVAREIRRDPAAEARGQEIGPREEEVAGRPGHHPGDAPPDPGWGQPPPGDLDLR